MNLKTNLNFNPRSREGSDGACPPGRARETISIHAPARGATVYHGVKTKDGYISIHAPARGATCCMDEFKNKFEFQSTLPRGERRRVSAGKSARNYFNPRSREGSDVKAPANRLIAIIFQSTLPRGERLLSHTCFFLPYDFNPRSREGSDSAAFRGSQSF